MKRTENSIDLNIHDIINAGGIEDAIISACEESDYLASGEIGGSYAQGRLLGNYQSKSLDDEEFARRALDENYGAAGYVSPHTGRIARLAEDESDPEIVWEDESCVTLALPTREEIDEDPNVAEEMASLVLDGVHLGDGEKWEWKEVLGMSRVDEEEALASIDGEIIGDSVLYWDEGVSEWYSVDRDALYDLRAKRGHPDEDVRNEAFTLWCGDNAMTHHENEEAARAALAEEDED